MKEHPQLEELTLDKAAASYFPIVNGKYDVGRGSFPFGTDFGNGYKDKNIFQIDSNFDFYRQNKMLSRKENLEKYYQTKNYWRI